MPRGIKFRSYELEILGQLTMKVYTVLTRIADVTDGQIDAQTMAKAYKVFCSDCNKCYFRIMNGDALLHGSRRFHR